MSSDKLKKKSTNKVLIEWQIIEFYTRLWICEIALDNAINEKPAALQFVVTS